jgi:dihydroflavonol-4-reductase
MKVLVLGGTGFVGAHVARAFAEAGHEVAVASRNAQAQADPLDGLDLERVTADLRDVASLTAAFQGRDVVVHAAGVLSLWDSDRETLYQVNVLGTRNVVQACLDAGVGRLLYDGSIGIYAGSTEPVPADERGIASSERFKSFHVNSMCLAEAEIWKGLARGLDAVLLHPALCLGVGDRSFHSSWALACISLLGLSFSPPGGLNAIDVQDVAKAHVAAADPEKAARGRSYLLGGENLTNLAYLELLRSVLGVKNLNLPVSRRGFKALGTFFHGISRVTGEDHGGYITLNQNLAHSMSLYWYVDDSLARRELGHAPAPIRGALERQLAWLRREGLLPEGRGLLEFARRFLRAPRS